ncbi:MAG: TIGR03936 family radical SAM-associated protein, partial [Myxococcales bacterium]|nr:TIGR03936 family radical SAM-associated protein [Myxococcales bacterium]
LPTETDEDVAGIVHTAAKARDIGLRYHNRSRLRVTASASSHVPKPHTPFQWAAMDSLEEIARKQKLLFELGRERNISLKWHDSRVSFVEGVLARGDRELADLVELAFRKGARMDSWDDVLRFEAWTEAMTELGVDAQRYLGTIPVDGRLPWDHIDVGLEPGFLKQEWKRATKNRLSPPCGKPKGAQVHHTNVQDAEADQRKLICYHCGIACDMTQMREERVDFLTKLGAMAPRDRDAEGEDAFVPAYRQIRKNRKNQNLPPIRPSQGQAHHYRLQYTKLGAVAMTSHLDLARVLPRILRRAGLTPVMSRGFSPAPQMSFGPALTLGVHALAELVDVQLTDDLAPDALLARLNAVSDEGLVFRAAARLRGKVHAPSRVAKLAEYVVRADTLDDGRLREAVAQLLAGERVPMTVARKEGQREIDVTDGLVSA